MAHIDCDGSYYDGSIDSDGLPDGYGVLHYDNGDVFSGYFRHGEMCGSGSYRFADGGILEGEFVNGEIHGKGSFVDSNYSYYGEFRYGKKHDYGHEHWSNGVDYQGDFYDDKKEGKGTMKHVDDSIYTGDFYDDMKHGQGKLVCENYTYDGGWYKDKCHGQCREYWSDSNSSFEGVYSYNERGYGTYYFSDGTQIEGPNKDFVSHGRCKYTCSNGDWYYAEWVNGEIKNDQKIEYHVASSGIAKWYLFKNGEWIEI